LTGLVNTAAFRGSYLWISTPDALFRTDVFLKINYWQGVVVNRLGVGLLIAAVWLACGDREAILAQAPNNPVFEVASVRSNESTAQPSSRFPLGPGDAYVPGNLFAATNQPLIAYLRFAFKLSQGELLDLPTWVYDEHFDISARASGSPTKDEMRLMTRSLLADRFKLKVHSEKRTRPAFNLVLARAGQIGPQLKGNTDDNACGSSTEPTGGAAPTLRATEPSSKSGLQLPPIPCGTIGQISASAPDKARIGGRKVTTERIAGFLKNPFTGVDRQVLDRTGLTGTFDFSLEWSPEPALTGPPDQAAASGPSFFEALRSQLGLRLVAATAPTDVLIIDRIERPDENWLTHNSAIHWSEPLGPAYRRITRGKSLAFTDPGSRIFEADLSQEAP
jgi:uncharacterized protein (TIGR03435 family)